MRLNSLPSSVLGVVRGNVDVGNLLLDDAEVSIREGSALDEVLEHFVFLLLFIIIINISTL